MADFILKLHTDETSDEDSNAQIEPIIPISLLKKYIKYAKSNVEPKLTNEAKEIIKNFYIKLRKQNKDDENSAIAVVARNLEGYIRIAEAYSKMALKNFVSEEDAEKSLKLAQRSLEDISTDPITGKLDADRILTGAPSLKSPIYKFLDELKKKIEENNGQPIGEEDFLSDLEFNLELDREKLEKLLKSLIYEGTVYRPSTGKIDIVKSRDEK
jgi:replicative DNA helicase Mcm